jgi:apolipoprotein N-acyltransferase
VDGFYHGHIAVMRAVEDGFSLVRAARHGLLTVADNRGRIVAEIGSGAAPFATLLATVPAGRSATLFLYLGDWFGWCAIALFALVLAQLARGSRKSALHFAPGYVVVDRHRTIGEEHARPSDPGRI